MKRHAMRKEVVGMPGPACVRVKESAGILSDYSTDL